MTVMFYLAAAVAVMATALAITRRAPVHALLYLIVALLALAVVFFLLGAPLLAALEVIVYAGAIMVLFLFVIMLLPLGPRRPAGSRLPPGRQWLGPAALCAVLLVEWLLLLKHGAGARAGGSVSPAGVGAALFGPYLLGVELASMLLLAGLVGALRISQPAAGGEEP